MSERKCDEKRGRADVKAQAQLGTCWCCEVTGSLHGFSCSRSWWSLVSRLSGWLENSRTKENILRKAWCVPSPQALGCERSETGHVAEPGEDGLAGSQEAGGLQIASGCLRGCGVLFSRCRKTFDGM